MNLSLTQVTQGALQDLAVLDSGGTASAQQLTDALNAANRLIDNWSSDRLMAAEAKIVTQATVGGTASYNIGTRYSSIEAASVIAPNPQTPLRVVNAIEWSQIVDRGVSGSLIRLLAQAAAGTVDVVEYSQFTDAEAAATILSLAVQKNQQPSLIQVISKLGRLATGTTFQPRYLFYDRSLTTPTIYLAGVPQTGTLQLVVWSALTQFADTTTPITLTQGYAWMLQKALAKALAGQYNLDIRPEVLADLADAMATIRGLNASILGQEPPEANIGPGGSPSPAPADSPYGPSGAAQA